MLSQLKNVLISSELRSPALPENNSAWNACEARGHFSKQWLRSESIRAAASRTALWAPRLVSNKAAPLPRTSAWVPAHRRPGAACAGTCCEDPALGPCLEALWPLAVRDSTATAFPATPHAPPAPAPRAEHPQGLPSLAIHRTVECFPQDLGCWDNYYTPLQNGWCSAAVTAGDSLNREILKVWKSKAS